MEEIALSTCGNNTKMSLNDFGALDQSQIEIRRQKKKIKNEAVLRRGDEVYEIFVWIELKLVVHRDDVDGKSIRIKKNRHSLQSEIVHIEPFVCRSLYSADYDGS